MRYHEKIKRIFSSAPAFPFVATLVLAFYLSCGRNTPAPIEKTVFLMDTVVNIKVFTHKGDTRLVSALIDSAVMRMAAIDSLANNYISESEIGRLNDSAGQSPVTLSADLKFMLTSAQKIDSLSQGSFTAAIGPLTELWGFGRRTNMEAPPANIIQKTLQHVGRKGLQLSDSQMLFLDPETRLDLGGIAKGYAVDVAIDFFQEHGLHDVQVDAGGDLRTLATTLTAGKRNVYVRHPLHGDEFYGRFPMDQGAVATSGDYERFFITDGIRYHHILDPHTGYSARTCRSVTIVGPTTIECDGLATAVFVLGPDEGMALIEHLPDIEGVILFEKDGQLSAKISSGLTPIFERL